MKFYKLFATTILLLAGLSTAHASDPMATITDLDTRLTKAGSASIKGTDQAGEKTVPALLFGDRK
ncbi:MAG: hypothetical protein ACI9ZF_002903, partial [Bradyrhizobium sp.]